MADLVRVDVIWNDAWVEGTEFVTEDVVKDTHFPWVVTTTGWLLQEDAAGVSLANEHCFVDGHTRYRGRTFIPRAMVLGVTPVLKPRRTRKAPASVSHAGSTAVTDA